ncbi:MAG TPA: PEP-CTERM sorting domain-containing protein [Desulfomonilia bacterium]|jgi:hypothetical protein
MKKVFAALTAMIFIMAGSALAAPITLKNSISFGDNPGDTISTGNGTGKLISYGSGHVHHLENSGDFIEWSHTFTFDPPADDSPLTGKLTIKFRDDGDIWLEYGRAFINGQEVMSREIDDMDLLFTARFINGQIVVRVENTGLLASDFYVNGADAELTYNPAAPAPAPAPVPEPATMTLIGVGMLAAGIVAKKRSRKSTSAE